MGWEEWKHVKGVGVRSGRRMTLYQSRDLRSKTPGRGGRVSLLTFRLKNTLFNNLPQNFTIFNYHRVYPRVLDNISLWFVLASC